MLASTLLSALTLLIGSVPVDAGKTVGVAAFQGRYQPLNPKQQAVVVGAAIDKSLSHLNLLVRWRAGDILRQNNQIATEIMISTQADKILVMTPLRKVWWTGLDGKPRAIVTPRGKKATLSRSYESSRLVERFVSERGKRTHRISLSKDGQLMFWQVTVESEELPTPIRYTLKYRRR